jgi:hypothetical protein
MKFVDVLEVGSSREFLVLGRFVQELIQCMDDNVRDNLSVIV